MFYISLLIDNRKYQVVTLFPENITRPEGIAVHTFIIQRNVGEDKTLFSIDDLARVVFKGGFSKDHVIDWGHLHTNLNDLDAYVDLLPVQKNKPITEPASSKGDLRVKRDAGKHFFGIPGRYLSQKIAVTLRFTLDGVAYSGQFVIHLVPPKQIFDVVMDFGSEASQIVIHQRGGGGSETLHRTKIVDHLIKYYYKHLHGAALHQKVDDPELYSSQFFTRKAGAVFDPTNPAGKHGEDELLNLLTDQKSIYDLASTHMFVSNLKLAHLGAYPQQIQFKSTDSNFYEAEHKRFDEIVLDLQQAVINYFIQMILEELRGGHKKGSQLYISVKLLVPNVFDQQKVSLVVNKTYQSFADIIEKNTEYPLAGWEVGTISESDASFLGFKREKESESRKTDKPYWVTDKDYLIIDAGKGTIDFSILQLSKKNQLTSIFRSGFIGAGNVISYAFVDTVFTALFDTPKENRQKAIYSICLAPHADMVAKIAFMQIIEQFKQNYDHAKNDQYKPLSDLIPVDVLSDIRTEYKENPAAPTLLTQIVDALRTVQQKQSSLRDEFGLIVDTVDVLVQKIDDEVRYSGFFKPARIEKIILTGRGFKFKRLEKAIADKFRIPVDTTSDLKKICLLGAFSGDRINFDSNLVGYPTIYKFVTNTSNQQVREVDKGASKAVVVIPVRDNIFWKATDIMYQKGSELIQKGADISKKFKESFTGTDGDEFGDRAAEEATDQDNGPSGLEDFFLRGEYFNNFNRDAQTVTVCGLDYKNHNIAKGRINVFFTGNEFIIRNETDYSPLGVYPRFFEETQWVFQTLYPFIEVTGFSDVKVVREFEDDVEMGAF